MGAAYNILSQYLPFIRKKPAIDRDKVLKACPVRHPAVRFERGEDGDMRLFLPRRKDRLAKALMWVFRAGPEKEIVLDEVGSDVWEMCDGSTSVDAIVGAIAKKYKITRRECETSIGVYLKTLGERNLVGLRVAGSSPSGSGRNQASNRGRSARKKR